MIPNFQPTHFTANEDDVQRARILNALVGNLRLIFAGISTMLGDGVVNSFTAGAGMVDSGTATDPVADIVAANGTIIVNPDSIEVGTITAANIEDGAIITDAELAEAVQPIRAEVEKLRIIMMQLVKLELGDQPDRGWEGLNG